MTHTISKKTNLTFNEALKKVTDELKVEGFGVITEIDLQKKFKEKLNIDFRRYTVLGACNPAMAYKAIQIDSNIGVMLPCNVLVQENQEGKVEVTAVNPLSSIGSIGNPDLQSIAEEVSEKLEKVINKVGS